MTELKELEETLIPFEIMDDGRADMNQISRSVHAALEYYRVGDEGGVNATTDEIALGKGIIQCSMQPFALECAIKGLLQSAGVKLSHKAQPVDSAQQTAPGKPRGDPNELG